MICLCRRRKHIPPPSRWGSPVETSLPMGRVSTWAIWDIIIESSKVQVLVMYVYRRIRIAPTCISGGGFTTIPIYSIFCRAKRFRTVDEKLISRTEKRSNG